MSTAAATADFNPLYWNWGQDGRTRVLHTMLRVKDIDSSMRFWIDGLGMKVLNRFDIESSRCTLVYMGFDSYEAGGVVELVSTWEGDNEYQHGSSYGHVAVGVPDVAAAVAKLSGMGYEINRPLKILVPGGPPVAFAKDSNGFEVELIQTAR
jgi:lactoylglutathione lyase